MPGLEAGPPLVHKVQVVIHTPGPSPRILLLQRPPDRGSIWQPVTGKIEAEDPGPAAAARREVLEETGIAQIAAIEDMARAFRFTRDGREFLERLLRAEVAHESVVTLSPEHVRYAWLDPDGALGRLSWSTNRAGLRHVLGTIATR